MPTTPKTAPKPASSGIHRRRRVRDVWTPERLTLALSTVGREAERVALTSDDSGEVLRACHALAAVAGQLRALHTDADDRLTRDDAERLAEALRAAFVDEARRVGLPGDSFARVAEALVTFPPATA